MLFRSLAPKYFHAQNHVLGALGMPQARPRRACRSQGRISLSYVRTTTSAPSMVFEAVGRFRAIRSGCTRMKKLFREKLGFSGWVGLGWVISTCSTIQEQTSGGASFKGTNVWLGHELVYTKWPSHTLVFV